MRILYILNTFLSHSHVTVYKNRTSCKMLIPCKNKCNQLCRNCCYINISNMRNIISSVTQLLLIKTLYDSLQLLRVQQQNRSLNSFRNQDSTKEPRTQCLKLMKLRRRMYWKLYLNANFRTRSLYEYITQLCDNIRTSMCKTVTRDAA